MFARQHQPVCIAKHTNIAATHCKQAAHRGQPGVPSLVSQWPVHCCEDDPLRGLHSGMPTQPFCAHRLVLSARRCRHEPARQLPVGASQNGQKLAVLLDKSQPHCTPLPAGCRVCFWWRGKARAVCAPLSASVVTKSPDPCHRSARQSDSAPSLLLSALTAVQTGACTSASQEEGDHGSRTLSADPPALLR